MGGYLADGEKPPPVMLANIDCDDSALDCQGRVDYSDACGFAVGDLPSFPEHPYPDANLKIYVRLESWVCHTQPNDPYNEQYTGSPHINCLSDNEVWNTNHPGWSCQRPTRTSATFTWACTTTEATHT